MHGLFQKGAIIMRINHNISAVITNKQLLRTENTLAASMERLSSGLRINHAKDNPSGMAISGKMQAQIDGLSQASRNSSDGISVIETADGALNEVTNIIQRMRELAVQAANDTNAQTEKDAIQTEIASLKQEIDRIASTTEFNTKTLLDGSLDARVYPDRNLLQPTRIQSNENVPAGQYGFTIDAAATQAEVQFNIGAHNPIPEDVDVYINGAKASLKKDMSDEQVYEVLRKAAELGEATISDPGDMPNFTIRSKEYGSEAALLVTTSDPARAEGIAIGPVGADGRTAVGKDAEITLDRTTDFGPQSTVRMKGNKMIITDSGGFEMSMKLPEGKTGNVSLEVTEIGPMDLQVGANEGQQMRVRIPPMDIENLYIDNLDVSTRNGASNAITMCDEALTYINTARAGLGAYANRLEYTVASLDTTEENMTAAISRIGDVDMAEEMVEYTKDNVLAQAGTSALSQANELPQMALQLLG